MHHLTTTRRSVFAVLSLLVLLAAVGCGNDTKTQAPPENEKVTVVLEEITSDAPGFKNVGGVYTLEIEDTDTAQFDASVLLSDGTSPESVIWEVAPASLGTIDATGLFTATSPGTGTISAYLPASASASADTGVTAQKRLYGGSAKAAVDAAVAKGDLIASIAVTVGKTDKLFRMEKVVEEDVPLSGEIPALYHMLKADTGFFVILMDHADEIDITPHADDKTHLLYFDDSGEKVGDHVIESAFAYGPKLTKDGDLYISYGDLFFNRKYAIWSPKTDTFTDIDAGDVASYLPTTPSIDLRDEDHQEATGWSNTVLYMSPQPADGRVGCGTGYLSLVDSATSTTERHYYLFTYSGDGTVVNRIEIETVSDACSMNEDGSLLAAWSIYNASFGIKFYDADFKPVGTTRELDGHDMVFGLYFEGEDYVALSSIGGGSPYPWVGIRALGKTGDTEWIQDIEPSESLELALLQQISTQDDDGKIILAAIGKTSGGEFKLFVGKAAYNFEPIDLE